jgi:hypothetical protein
MESTQCLDLAAPRNSSEFASRQRQPSEKRSRRVGAALCLKKFPVPQLFYPARSDPKPRESLVEANRAHTAAITRTVKSGKLIQDCERSKDTASIKIRPLDRRLSEFVVIRTESERVTEKETSWVYI